MITKDFLRQLFRGEKKLLPLRDVRSTAVPKYDELGVVSLTAQMKEDAHFQAYFPDKLPKGRNPGREYFFNVLNTLHPDYVQALVEHAQKLRYSAGAPE